MNRVLTPISLVPVGTVCLVAGLALWAYQNSEGAVVIEEPDRELNFLVAERPEAVAFKISNGTHHLVQVVGFGYC